MSRPRLALTVLAAIGSITTLLGLLFLGLSWNAPVPDSWGFRGFTSIFAIAFGGVGALVTYRRPENAVGWLLLVAGTLGGVQICAEEYAIYGVIGRAEPLPGAAIAGWFESWIWLATISLAVVYMLALFPDGTYLSPRWRWLGWVTAIDIAVGVIGIAFQDGPLNNAPFIDNPFPFLGTVGRIYVQGWTTNVIFYAGFSGVGLLGILAAFSVIRRYRRATGPQRQQLKWLVLGAVVLAVVTLNTTFAQLVTPSSKVFQALFIAAVSFLPVTIGIAILRHRLYDIDVLINRTLVYGFTTAAIAAVFFGGIVLLQTLLRPITGGSQIAVAVSTLMCFALFQPVRDRVQGGVDRRFYRARYDAARTLDVFSERLRDMVDLGAVRASLLEAVGETFEPASASIWLPSVTFRGRSADRTES